MSEPRNESNAADELVFACAILRRDNQALIVRPISTGPKRSKWAFPAGPVEADESPEAACRRMCREKLSAEIEIDLGQPPLHDTVAGQPVIYRYYIGTVIGLDVGNEGFAEVRWVAMGQLRDYEFDPVSQMVVDWLLEEQ